MSIAFENVSESFWRTLAVVGKRPAGHTLLSDRDDGEEVYGDFDLWLGVRGCCTVEILGQTIEMRAGRMVLVPPCVTVRKLTDSQEEMEMWFLHFDCYLSGQLITDARPYVDRSDLSLALPGLPTIAMVADVNWERLLEKLLGVRSRPQGDLRQLLSGMAVMSAISRLRATYLGSADSKAEERLERAMQFMEHNLSRHLLLEEIAEHAEVSRETLTRLFRERYRTSPMRYLSRMRLAQVQEAIQHRRSSISEVARACGYSSLQYFNKVFRKEFGTSPRDYRKKLFRSS